MIERRHCMRFPRKAAYPVGVGSKFGRQQFDGDLTFQSGVERQMNFTHSTSTQRCQDLITANL